MFPVGVILALAGLVLYLLARRGFSVGSHPTCARCRFNLTGLPKQHARCPECGADILAADAVIIGTRRPVLLGMAAGGLVLVAGGALSGAGAVKWWKTFDASAWKPVSLLLGDLTASSNKKRDPALRELNRRINRRALSDSQTQSMAALVLKQQKIGAGWDDRWGDLMQQAALRKAVPDETWKEYLRGAMQVSATVRPRVRQGDPVPLRLDVRLRAGQDFTGIAPGKLVPEVTVSRNGVDVPVTLFPVQLELLPLPAEWAFFAPVDPDVMSGPRTVRVAAKISLTDLSGQTVAVENGWDLTYDLLPSDVESTTLHAATGQEQAEMRSAVRWGTEGQVTVRPDQAMSLGNLLISGPPVPAAFRVVLRQRGREWRLARVLVPAGEWKSIELSLPAQSQANGPAPGPAELVCVPEKDLAMGTVDVLEIWGEEIRRGIEIVAE